MFVGYFGGNSDRILANFNYLKTPVPVQERPPVFIETSTSLGWLLRLALSALYTVNALLPKRLIKIIYAGSDVFVKVKGRG